MVQQVIRSARGSIDSPRKENHMRRVFRGVKLDENLDYNGISKFIIFGQMDDGTSCYHEIDENGEEIEDAWYSRQTRQGMNIFFLEGE